MSDKSKKDEQSIEDKMREHWDELRNRALNLGNTQHERARGVDPENVIDGHFVERPERPQSYNERTGSPDFLKKLTGISQEEYGHQWTPEAAEAYRIWGGDWWRHVRGQ